MKMNLAVPGRSPIRDTKEGDDPSRLGSASRNEGTPRPGHAGSDHTATTPRTSASFCDIDRRAHRDASLCPAVSDLYMQRRNEMNDSRNHTRLLTLIQVTERTTLSKQEIYRRIKRGDFPRQIRLGVARVAWVESEIEDWICWTVSRSRSEGVLLPHMLP